MSDVNTFFKTELIPDKQDFISAGVHFGHQVQRWNPKMSSVIKYTKNNIHIIDVDKTIESLGNAVKFLSTNQSSSPVLIVGTKKQARKLTENLAVSAGCHFIDRRWIGGLLTNFEVIKNSLNRLLSLEKFLREGVWDRTKYEVSLMKKEWSRLSTLYRGVKTMAQKPSAIIVLDVGYEKVAVKEAKIVGIPIVGVVDTNANPSGIDYPIYANDDAIKSIKFIYNAIEQSLMQNSVNERVVHDLKDYSLIDVKISSSNNNYESTGDSESQTRRVIEVNVVSVEQNIENKQKRVRSTKKSTASKSDEAKKGILGRYQAEKLNKKS